MPKGPDDADALRTPSLRHDRDGDHRRRLRKTDQLLREGLHGLDLDLDTFALAVGRREAGDLESCAHASVHRRDAADDAGLEGVAPPRKVRALSHHDAADRVASRPKPLDLA